MNGKKIFGIFRETSHSPEREFDDAEILRLTAKRLGERIGTEVPLIEPDEFLSLSIEFSPELIFFMCEETPCLEKLAKLKGTTGCTLVNSVEGVENTFRRTMTKLLSSKEYFPKSIMVPTKNITSKLSLPDLEMWIKRGDYHAIEKDDVIFTKDIHELKECLYKFYKRGIDTAVIQKHIPGDIIKFYCIKELGSSSCYWFKWFYHKDQELKQYPFSPDELYLKCHDAGETLKLEIYGGDAIVNKNGEVFIIDINAWPSFALFRQEASEAIASLLHNRLVLRKKNDLNLGRSSKLAEKFSFFPS